MGKNKERKTTEKKSIFNSFAVRVGLIVSLVLLVVLGAKAVFDNNYEKETAIQNVETAKLERRWLTRLKVSLPVHIRLAMM